MGLKTVGGGQSEHQFLVGRFCKLRKNLLERLGENRKELAEDYSSYLSETQTLENLQQIQALIIQDLKWSTSPETEIYVRIEEVIQKKQYFR